MGRTGTHQARWTGLSRLGRAGLVAAALAAGAVVAGAALSGQGAPPPVVWHDQVSDGPTPAP